MSGKHTDENQPLQSFFSLIPSSRWRDLSAGDFVSRVSGGLSGEIVKSVVQNDRLADDFLNGEAIRQKR